MTGDLELHPRTSTELEPRPKFLIHFEGFDHSDYNLQGLDRVRRSLTDVAANTDGRTLVYLESGNTTQASVNRAKSIDRNYGLAGATIASIYVAKNGIEPSVDFVKRRGEQIEKLGLDESINRGYIPKDFIQHYYLRLMLDDLRKSHNLEINYETHSVKVADIVKRDFADFHRATKESFIAWHNGDFNGSLQAWRDYHRTERQVVELREAEIVENIKFYARRLLREKTGGAVFMLMGAQHEVVLAAAENKIDPNGKSVKFSASTNPAEPFSFESDKYVRLGQEIPTLLLARMVISNMIRNDVAIAAHKNGEVKSFCDQFMDVSAEITSAVSRLTLDQIRLICESRRSALKVLTGRL